MGAAVQRHALRSCPGCRRRWGPLPVGSNVLTCPSFCLPCSFSPQQLEFMARKRQGGEFVWCGSQTLHHAVTHVVLRCRQLRPCRLRYKHWC